MQWIATSVGTVSKELIARWSPGLGATPRALSRRSIQPIIEAKPTSSSRRPISHYAGMRDGDGLFIANFRADRVREMAAALLDPDFSGFSRERRVAFAAALGLVEYSN